MTDTLILLKAKLTKPNKELRPDKLRTTGMGHITIKFTCNYTTEHISTHPKESHCIHDRFDYYMELLK
jgi:hypothetical protein